MEKQISPMEAYNDQVLVEVASTGETTTASGLFVPPPRQGTGVSFGKVLAVGPGFLMEGGHIAPLDQISVGDTVIFTPQSGVEFEIQGQKLVCVRYGTLLGRLPPEYSNSEECFDKYDELLATTEKV